MNYFDPQTLYFCTCCGIALGFLYYFANLHQKIEKQYPEFIPRRRMIIFCMLSAMLFFSCLALGIVVAIRYILINSY